MSLFATLTRLSSNMVDSIMGERLRITPRTEATYTAGGVDETRPVADVVGKYMEYAGQTRIGDAAAGRDFERRFNTPKLFFSIQRAAIGDKVFRSKDRITRLELPGEPQFEITEIEPLDDGRTAFYVVIVEAET
jgi:hypothetical protein